MAATDRGSRTRAGEPADRGTLSRAQIVEAAIAHVDQHGVNALTMRRLGSDLGVEAMSLYRYVNGREDLLEAIVDYLMDDLEIEPGDEIGPGDGWQAYLQWFAHQVRELALRHPAVFPLVATRHPAAPWLRPPLRSLEVVESFLDGLVSRGFSEEQAVQTYRAFSSFLLGHLLLETAGRGASTAPADEPLDEGGADIPNRDADLSLADYPTLMRLKPLLSEDDTAAEFERSLEGLLDRLDRTLSQ